MEQQPGEETINWQDMDVPRCKVVLETLSLIMSLSERQSVNLRRIMDLANPDVIWGPEKKYFRIAPQSTDLVNLLTKQYLDE